MQVHDSKRKNLSLFKSSYIQLQSVVSSLTPRKYTVQAVPSKKKKKPLKRWKRGEEEKRDGKSLCERKGKRENEMRKKRRNKRRDNEREGEGEERRGRERRTENIESGIRSVPPSPDAFPSMKLGNNITPIKGRLGKNTTPTSRDPTELNQNP